MPAGLRSRPPVREPANHAALVFGSIVTSPHRRVCPNEHGSLGGSDARRGGRPATVMKSRLDCWTLWTFWTAWLRAETRFFQRLQDSVPGRLVLFWERLRVSLTS